MEISSSHSELVIELRGWCRGEAVPEDHAVMLVIPSEVDISVIEETMQTVKSLGRVRGTTATLPCVSVEKPQEEIKFLLKCLLLKVEGPGL